METYKVQPIDIVKLREKGTVYVQVPGSKSITNRALLLAALGDGKSTLKNALFSEDSRHFIQCLKALGFEVTVDELAKEVTVMGCNGTIPLEEASIYVGSAGTAARFLAAMLGTSRGVYQMDASPQMRKRPMAPLLDALKSIGAELTFQDKEGFFPFQIQGKGILTQSIAVDIKHSSQFLSALLMSATCSEKPLDIHILGEHGLSYIHITTHMMSQFGGQVESLGDKVYRVMPGHYQARAYDVEPDLSAACYFYALVPLLGITVCVDDVHLSGMQGDLEFLNILVQMGCQMEQTEKGVLLHPPIDNQIQGIEVDMSTCSDQTMTLAAIAPFATTATKITGISHIQYQESNRIQAIITELTKMGIRCETCESGIVIYPGQPNPTQVDTYEDHRMAMAFALIGLRVPGIVINDPKCCAKTFENYFEVLESAVGLK